MQEKLSCTSMPSERPVDVCLGEHAYFIYEKEIEYLLATIELLCDYGVNAKIHEVYSEDFVIQQKENYPLLFEIFKSFRMHSYILFATVLVKYAEKVAIKKGTLELF